MTCSMQENSCSQGSFSSRGNSSPNIAALEASPPLFTLDSDEERPFAGGLNPPQDGNPRHIACLLVMILFKSGI